MLLLSSTVLRTYRSHNIDQARLIHLQFQYASGELSQLLRDIALASKVVNREVNKAGLIDIMGAVGSQNSGGEQQQKLDVLANIRFTRALTKGGEACALISEETESYLDLKNDSNHIISIVF